MLLRIIKNIFRGPCLFVYNWFIFDQWEIYIRKNKSPMDFSNMRDFKRIRPPNGHCYADPFISKKDGRNYLFYEDYDFEKDKGIIACMELSVNGQLLTNAMVLERDYHLSFPFIFEYDKQIYMIPESLGSNRIELYRAIDFPYSWTFEKVLVDKLSCADTNIFHYNNKYWMFTCVMGEKHNKDLYLFYSDNPLKNWTMHSGNPVVEDVSNARPAGNIFLHEKSIYRVSQDCSIRYGYALHFNTVNEINEKEFKETLVQTLRPTWKLNNLSNHTYNSNEDFEVIDALRFQIDILKPFRKIRQKLYKRKMMEG